MIGLFIIDDHPGVAKALHYDMRPARYGIRITGSALNIESVIDLINQNSVDIIILDLHLPEPDDNPINNVARLRKRWPGKRIVIYTMELQNVWIRAMHRVAVDGYVTKDFDGIELIKAIRIVSEGGRFFPEHILSSREDDQTSKQSEIIKLLGDDHSIKEVSEITGLTSCKIHELLRKAKKQFNVRTNYGLFARTFHKI